MNKEIGNRIRVERVRKQMSQDNMATELSISIGAYSNIERGKVDMTVNRLYQIADIFHVNVSVLLPGYADKESAGTEDAASIDELRRELERVKQDIRELKEAQPKNTQPKAGPGKN